MSRLPQLEAQLVAAAAVRSRPRAPRRIAAGLLATAAAAAAVLAFAPRGDAPPPRIPASEGVPEATIARSHALAAEAPPSTDPLTEAQVTTVAASLQARTPYPPGMSDGFDWAARASMLGTVSEVQHFVEYRAYCLWLKYWLSGADVRGATTVIADIPQWPTQRQTDPFESARQQSLIASVESNDADPIRREVALNCRGV